VKPRVADRIAPGKRAGFDCPQPLKIQKVESINGLIDPISLRLVTEIAMAPASGGAGGGGKAGAVLFGGGERPHRIS
jgi:hypothetical protein